jgi:hypothetical protein
MRCSATTHRGIRCKRIGKGTDQNTQLLCKEHLQIFRRHTCVYFLPKQRRYCKVTVGPNGRLCKRHDGMAGIVQWGLLPSIVWANVGKWLHCHTRRTARCASKSFDVRYAFNQCTCIRNDSEVLQSMSKARYTFWRLFISCVLTYIPHKRLPTALTLGTELSELRPHYSSWLKRLQIAYDRWMGLLKKFRYLHSMYSGEIQSQVLNAQVFPNDEFTCTDCSDQVWIRRCGFESELIISDRFYTEDGDLIPTEQCLMLLYGLFKSEWDGPVCWLRPSKASLFCGLTDPKSPNGSFWHPNGVSCLWTSLL